MAPKLREKLLYSGQTASIIMNVLALIVLYANTGVSVTRILHVVGAILAIDLVVEICKLAFVPHNTNPAISKWEGAARTFSIAFNIMAIALIFIPLGIEPVKIVNTVGIIVIVDLVVEVVEWFRM